MTRTEAQFIHERCLGLIRKVSMNVPHWEWTILGAAHDGLKSEIKNGELPIVSFYADEDDWTLLTTNRIVASLNGLRSGVDRSNLDQVDYGNFKQDVDSPRITRAILKHTHGKAILLYESGYASMAPIYYFRFWEYKWPVWKETYKKLKNENRA